MEYYEDREEDFRIINTDSIPANTQTPTTASVLSVNSIKTRQALKQKKSKQKLSSQVQDFLFSLRMEPGVLGMLDKSSDTEIQPEPQDSSLYTFMLVGLCKASLFYLLYVYILFCFSLFLGGENLIPGLKHDRKSYITTLYSKPSIFISVTNGFCIMKLE